MGYMGDNIGDVFSLLETDKDMRDNFDATTRELGNIDIYLWNDQTEDWELQDGFYETGPIAINRQFIPLSGVSSGKDVRLKLVLNKGLWRIDYAALTNIKQKVMPVEITPKSVLNKGEPDNTALSEIKSPEQYLISMPGSEYKISFDLPDPESDYELFLYSKGYYLEWMREHWLKDKNLFKLKQMVDSPKDYLRTEAQNYKLYEAHMEQLFWSSRIDTKAFSYDEN
jgi:hypothetical protein